MDLSAMKTMLELQALQNLNTSGQSNSSTLASSNNTLFANLLNDLLNGQSDGTSNALNGLGSVGTLQQLLNAMPNESKVSTTNASNYIASFMLHGNSNFVAVQNEVKEATNVSEQSTIEQYVKDYTGKTAFNNLLAGAEQYREEISKAAETYQIPEKLIAAVMKQESNFNASAVSSAGASGLMQLMPATANYLGITNRFNPEENIMGGAKYLRQMLNQFDHNLETALAAYNAGPGNVKKYNGIPPFKETQNYVKKVLNYFNT